MPRTYHKKGIHTSPEKAGAQNMPADLPKEKENIMAGIYPVYLKSKENKCYCGQWTDEQFGASIDDFFKYCFENRVKPTKPLLELWMGGSRGQFYDWRTKRDKYGVKSDLLNTAMETIEAYLTSNVDSYPTGSIFLLKATHGYKEVQNIEINKAENTTAEELNDTISKLGLGDDQ